jgi:hypothetical protein
VAGISVIETTEQVAVTPSVTYSTLTQMKAGNASLEGRTNIRWYQASHAASAITPVSNGAFTALSTTAWTPVLLNAVTSPADAAFGAVEIEWRHTVTTTVGMFINVDNTVLSRSTQAAWGPGGATTNIKFVIERSADGGSSWEAVWGQNYDNPAPARSQSDTRIIIRDRATPLNNATLRYRCYAIGYDTNNLPVYSLATVTTAGTVPPVLSTTGFMREPENTFWDGPLQIDSYSRGYALGGEPFAPQGSDYGMVQYDTSPMVETIDYTIWCIGSTALNLLLNQLMLRKTLLVQLALNSVRYIRPMGDATFVQVLAAPLSTDVAAVRSVHKVTFRAVTIQPPNYITKLVTV